MLRMINLKHIGIYVKNIEAIADFYKNVFGLIAVTENVHDSGELYRQLFGVESKVVITKLITEYGQITGNGEMLEFIYVDEGAICQNVTRKVQDFGLSHISLGVNDINSCYSKVVENGGKIKTDIIQIGQKKCFFCEDIEGNIIELIQ